MLDDADVLANHLEGRLYRLEQDSAVIARAVRWVGESLRVGRLKLDVEVQRQRRAWPE